MLLVETPAAPSLMTRRGYLSISTASVRQKQTRVKTSLAQTDNLMYMRMKALVFIAKKFKMPIKRAFLSIKL